MSIYNGAEIILPWPHPDLSPNARVHYLAKARLAKKARADAHMLAAMTGVRPPDEGTVVLSLGFHPPDKRRRDLDGMLSSIKSALDGIADAMGIDDQRFGLVLSREEPVKQGKVSVTVSWQEGS